MRVFDHNRVGVESVARLQYSRNNITDIEISLCQCISKGVIWSLKYRPEEYAMFQGSFKVILSCKYVSMCYYGSHNNKPPRAFAINSWTDHFYDDTPRYGFYQPLYK